MWRSKKTMNISRFHLVTQEGGVVFSNSNEAVELNKLLQATCTLYIYIKIAQAIYARFISITHYLYQHAKQLRGANCTSQTLSSSLVLNRNSYSYPLEQEGTRSIPKRWLAFFTTTLLQT
jgi:hypothetical protein